MNKKCKFKSWLENTYISKRTNKKLSKNSVNKYYNAIDTMLDELYSTSAISKKIDIYSITDVKKVKELLDKYLSTDVLAKKDDDGGRMYSNSLLRYVDYLNYEKSNELELQNNKKSELFKKRNKSNTIKLNGQEKNSRNSSIIDYVLKYNSYQCECDKNHKSFVSKKTKENYVEGHHLIPLKFENDFKFSLDTEANIISLCPTCHRMLHNGIFDDKIILLENLYKKRKTLLEKSGIEISFKELLQIYEEM